MRKPIFLAAATLAIAVPAVSLAAPSPENGRLVFNKWCAPCHARTPPPRLLPGSEALRLKYKGQKPAFIEDWTDLTPDLVKYLVRNGIQAMPPTRKTEVTDSELNDLGAYLTQGPGRPRSTP